jgi:hypothetical protein
MFLIVPPMSFTYHKAQSKIYPEPNLCKSWGLWMGGFLHLFNNGKVFTFINRHHFLPPLKSKHNIPPIFKTEIQGYTVPSTYCSNFCQVLYVGAQPNWRKLTGVGRFFLSLKITVIMVSCAKWLNWMLGH